MTVTETFFDDLDPAAKWRTQRADIVRHRFCTDFVPGSKYARSYSLWINLENDPANLLARMSRHTRSQIRRAGFEGIRYEFTSAPGESWIEQFFDFYGLFARSKKLKPLDRSKVLAVLDQHALDFSRVLSRDGRVLAWHANIRTGKYVVVELSASLFRLEIGPVAAYIGRANRLLHWLDMLRFREEGFSVYDLGGWYPGTRNEELLRVNRFKQGFGGDLILRYNCDRGLTWKGTLALWLRYSVLPNRSRE